MQNSATQNQAQSADIKMEVKKIESQKEKLLKETEDLKAQIDRFEKKESQSMSAQIKLKSVQEFYSQQEYTQYLLDHEAEIQNVDLVRASYWIYLASTVFDKYQKLAYYRAIREALDFYTIQNYQSDVSGIEEADLFNSIRLLSYALEVFYEFDFQTKIEIDSIVSLMNNKSAIQWLEALSAIKSKYATVVHKMGLWSDEFVVKNELLHDIEFWFIQVAKENY